MAQGFSLLRGLKDQFGDPIVLEIDTSLSSGLIFGFQLSTGVAGLTSNLGNAYSTLVTWGDGTFNYYTPPNIPVTHTYASSGVYQVKIYGRVRGLMSHGTAAYAQKLKRILSWGNSPALNLVSIGQNSKLIEVPNYLPATVKSLNNMFLNCATFNDPNITYWDTSNVTIMTNMFQNATSFNQSISNFSFNSATSILSMLSGCGMSAENYSKTLIGWSNTISSTGLGKNLSLGTNVRSYTDIVYSGSPYNSGEGARTYLTTASASGGAGWTITGDSFLAVIPEGSTGFLVDYASPKFAYSLRNMYSTYVGKVIRVRRSSDSVESDFTSNEVANGTLATWVGAGNDGFVTKWYDQSTNRNHLTQTTTSNQPKIVSAGTLITEAGLPALEFASDGNSWMQATTRITDARSVFMTASSSYTGSDYMFVLGDTVSASDYHAGTTSLFDSAYIAANVRFGANKLNNVVTNFEASGPGGTRTALGRVLLSMIHAGSNIIMNSLSKDRNNTGRSWRGKVQELVVYSTDQTANSAGIHSNVNSHYSIY